MLNERQLGSRTQREVQSIGSTAVDDDSVSTRK